VKSKASTPEADAQLRLVSEGVRAHARQADQGLVLRRIGAVVGDIDLVAHSSSFGCHRTP
jgi:hypothetical protein